MSMPTGQRHQHASTDSFSKTHRTDKVARIGKPVLNGDGGPPRRSYAFGVLYPVGKPKAVAVQVSVMEGDFTLDRARQGTSLEQRLSIGAKPGDRTEVTDDA